ncbi:EamA family transporter [Candidatus Woesearchaeota archaeon]|nr:EamA family transporter [Candidatus Woesearchaeota archaeon]
MGRNIFDSVWSEFCRIWKQGRKHDIYRGDMMTTELWSIGLVIFASAIGSLGPIFLKKASANVSFSVRSLFDKKLIAGIFFYGMATIFFIPALKGGDLSVLYPLVATMYIWVSLLSVNFLNEKMNKFKWIGILSIILGVAFIGLGS